MYFDDYPPGQCSFLDVQSLDVDLGSRAPIIRIKVRRRALGLVREWAAEHRDELMENWLLADAHESLHRIAPLE